MSGYEYICLYIERERDWICMGSRSMHIVTVLELEALTPV